MVKLKQTREKIEKSKFAHFYAKSILYKNFVVCCIRFENLHDAHCSLTCVIVWVFLIFCVCIRTHLWNWNGAMLHGKGTTTQGNLKNIRNWLQIYFECTVHTDRVMCCYYKVISYLWNYLNGAFVFWILCAIRWKVPFYWELH